MKLTTTAIAALSTALVLATSASAMVSISDVNGLRGTGPTQTEVQSSVGDLHGIFAGHSTASPAAPTSGTDKMQFSAGAGHNMNGGEIFGLGDR